jgi:spore germination cell wall hydrolase CwlJ-like protein|tara:strand:- start:452 stop:979 length:528 start_codon:yes stop_codon:yes gene_type:complete
MLNRIFEEGLCRFIFGTLLILLLALFALSLSPGTAKADHVEVNHKDLECLAKNIYFESRGEDVLGQYAVGLVTQNRVKSNKFPDTICGVVKQGRYWKNNPVKNKCHFSWFCDGKSDNPKDKEAWAISVHIAQSLLLYTIEDFTQGSTHYHALDVSPRWSRKMKEATTIGSHIFYE